MASSTTDGMQRVPPFDNRALLTSHDGQRVLEAIQDNLRSGSVYCLTGDADELLLALAQWTNSRGLSSAVLALRADGSTVATAITPQTSTASLFSLAAAGSSMVAATVLDGILGLATALPGFFLSSAAAWKEGGTKSREYAGAEFLASMVTHADPAVIYVVGARPNNIGASELAMWLATHASSGESNVTIIVGWPAAVAGGHQSFAHTVLTLHRRIQRITLGGVSPGEFASWTTIPSPLCDLIVHANRGSLSRLTAVWRMLSGMDLARVASAGLTESLRVALLDRVHDVVSSEKARDDMLRSLCLIAVQGSRCSQLVLNKSIAATAIRVKRERENASKALASFCTRVALTKVIVEGRVQEDNLWSFRDGWFRIALEALAEDTVDIDTRVAAFEIAFDLYATDAAMTSWLLDLATSAGAEKERSLLKHRLSAVSRMREGEQRALLLLAFADMDASMRWDAVPEGLELLLAMQEQEQAIQGTQAYTRRTPQLLAEDPPAESIRAIVLLRLDRLLMRRVAYFGATREQTELAMRVKSRQWSPPTSRDEALYLHDAALLLLEVNMFDHALPLARLCVDQVHDESVKRAGTYFIGRVDHSQGELKSAKAAYLSTLTHPGYHCAALHALFEVEMAIARQTNGRDLRQAEVWARRLQEDAYRLGSLFHEAVGWLDLAFVKQVQGDIGASTKLFIRSTQLLSQLGATGKLQQTAEITSWWRFDARQLNSVSES
jgi:hypothetical protein